ncbi:MAG: 1,4-dihydroxy-6-naphthoate synthase [Chitinophagaceae bacterium]
MKLSLGFSPCPNDTFIFEALVSNRIDCAGLNFELVLEDVQTLNEWAQNGKLDITKLSFPALFQNESEYRLLSAGAALGRGVGPLLVSNRPLPADPASLADLTVALPGINTTANLLFQLVFPNSSHKTQMLFSEIESAVLSKRFDLGVLIHENRFTYAERGLHLVADLGTIWEHKMNVPIPLGAIAIRKSLGFELEHKMNELIRESLQFAWKNYPHLPGFVTSHAQEMSEEVMRKHIELYVNDYSMDLGIQGRSAIDRLRTVAAAI